MTDTGATRAPRTTPAQWTRLEPLVDAMLELPPDERDAYVVALAARDSELGSDLKNLLDHSGRADSVLDSAAAERFALLFDDASDQDFDNDLRGQLQASLGAAYAIEHELSGGGMSRVFVAREAELGRHVVVKVLAPTLSTGINIERFEREIRVAASLQQANIVPVLSAGRAGPLSYYTMPLVEGRSLRERLKREGALPIRDALNVLRDVARGLVYAHEHGVVHRDIKPGNILLSGGAAVVIDFGIAKALDAARDEQDATLTEAGAALGTPMYAAPEQVSADQSADHRADIYALGVVAYELLTGHPPFTGRSAQHLIAAHITEPPTPVDRQRASIPPALAELVMRCLAKRPADRPQTAAEVCGLLDAIGPANGDGVPSAEMARAAASRRYSRSLLATAMVGLVLLAGWFALHQPRRADQLNPNRFVVTPFRNLTGDSTLEVIGSLIAVGVASGLEQLDSIMVVSSSTGVTDSVGRLRSLATIDPIAIGKQTRAGRALAGSYSRHGDTLWLQAQIVDVNTGAIERTFDPVVGELSAPNGAIERLRDNVATELEASAARHVIGSIGHLPTLQAYREFAYTLAMTGAQAFPHLIRATQLDTTFTLALYHLGVAFVEREQWKAADSVVQILSARRDSFTPVERDLFGSLDGYAHADCARDLAASRELFRRDSTGRIAGGIAFIALCANRPREARTVLRAVSPASTSPYEWAYWNKMTLADHMLGKFREEMATATKGRTRLPPWGQAFMLDDQTRALAALGHMADLRQKVDSSVAGWSLASGNQLFARYDIADNPGETYEHVAAELFAHDRAAVAMSYVNRGIAWHATQPTAYEATDAAQQSLAHLLMRAGRFDSAQVIWARLAIRDTLYTDARVQLAITAAWRRDTALAERTMHLLDSMANIKYAFGRPLVREARIAAALGRKADAVALLDSAMKSGASFDWKWHRDAEFQSLRDYAPFQALIAPKG